MPETTPTASPSRDAQEEVVVVEMRLAMTAQEFRAQEDSFLTAVAAAAKVSRADVLIRSITEVSQRRDVVRRLLATSVDVDVAIKTSSAAAVMEDLQEDTLTAELQKQGLPAPINFTAKVAQGSGPVTPSPEAAAPPSAPSSSPPTQDAETTGSGTPLGIIVAASAAGVVLVGAAAYFVLGRKAGKRVENTPNASDIERGNKPKFLPADSMEESSGELKSKACQSEVRHNFPHGMLHEVCVDL
jgi:ribosomal protein L20A (L18A)